MNKENQSLSNFISNIKRGVLLTTNNLDGFITSYMLDNVSWVRLAYLEDLESDAESIDDFIHSSCKYAGRNYEILMVNVTPTVKMLNALTLRGIKWFLVLTNGITKEKELLKATYPLNVYLSKDTGTEIMKELTVKNINPVMLRILLASVGIKEKDDSYIEAGLFFNSEFNRVTDICHKYVTEEMKNTFKQRFIERSVEKNVLLKYSEFLLIHLKNITELLIGNIIGHLVVRGMKDKPHYSALLSLENKRRLRESYKRKNILFVLEEYDKDSKTHSKCINMLDKDIELVVWLNIDFNNITFSIIRVTEKANFKDVVKLEEFNFTTKSNDGIILKGGGIEIPYVTKLLKSGKRIYGKRK